MAFSICVATPLWTKQVSTDMPNAENQRAGLKRLRPALNCETRPAIDGTLYDLPVHAGDHTKTVDLLAAVARVTPG